jgi:hypothetical protein
MTNHCWVLLRPDMAWHALAQGCRDQLGLFGRMTCCAETTPVERLDVLAFTQMQPRTRTGGTTMCLPCLRIINLAWTASVNG